MGKYHWHVSRVGEKPEIVRHYSWITKMYRFILRNPAMFAGRELTIYKNDEPCINLHFDEVKRRFDLQNKEGIERKQIISMSKEDGE
ncbi:hypothetical protein [Enterococcus devriesei]|uniref:hypothetical protein n=1 Tax=Enterococcus devriesei TaxID=319970 RepID=UPI0028A9B7B0|nr:hypothetical protein [Enterococcus devriesei]